MASSQQHRIRGKYFNKELKAKEVVQLYQASERNFEGAILRGQSFKGQILSGADFSEADIRGANFTDVNLTGANFCDAQCGLPNFEVFLEIAFFRSIKVLHKIFKSN